ncbi:MAG TPA: S-(hydroxymethyl)mycothiol dehydrogenase [Pseudonocardiaceae bacterium]|nr:S-(hydroxymethyl)mycothiol dehydrogenase [Pseudonocardiaceae bacterium]
MASKASAVVALGKGLPVEVHEIVVPDPGPNEVTVRVRACGVCRTDLHYLDGVVGDQYPYLLGHEAAGVVEQVGSQVRDVSPGDFVILNWRAVCGQCRPCRRGRPVDCVSELGAAQSMTLTTGEPLGAALGIGALAERTMVHSGQCTIVDPAVDPAVAALLGCGAMAGIGAATNSAQVAAGDWVAVIGVGGVGSAAVLGARLAGATRIVAVDIDERKLAGARRFGATDVIDASQVTDVSGAIRELTDDLGADVVIDTVGCPETWRQAFYARRVGGVFVLVGRPDSSMRLELPLLDAFLDGGIYRTSWYGDCLPGRDFPALVDLHLRGMLPLEQLVSERIGLSDIEQAFDSLRRGDVLRSVVLFD